MRNWLGVVLVSLGGAMSIAACSSTPAEKYPSPDAFCDAKATEECQIAGACGVPVDQCKAARKTLCNAAANAALGERRTYTSGNVQACIDKTHALYQKAP